MRGKVFYCDEERENIQENLEESRAENKESRLDMAVGESGGDTKIARDREWGTEREQEWEERERIARGRPRRAIDGAWGGQILWIRRVAEKGCKARMLLWTRYL